MDRKKAEMKLEVRSFAIQKTLRPGSSILKVAQGLMRI